VSRRRYLLLLTAGAIMHETLDCCCNLLLTLNLSSNCQDPRLRLSGQVFIAAEFDPPDGMWRPIAGGVHACTAVLCGCLSTIRCAHHLWPSISLLHISIQPNCYILISFTLSYCLVWERHANHCTWPHHMVTENVNSRSTGYYGSF